VANTFVPSELTTLTQTRTTPRKESNHQQKKNNANHFWQQQQQQQKQKQRVEAGKKGRVIVNQTQLGMR
jgi:hypothetical protein